MTARLTPRARADLLEIEAFIGADDPAAAERWLRRALAKVELIGEMPGAGTLLRRGRPRRFLVFGRYLIVYDPEPGGALILRILHGARDWRRLV